MLTLSTGGNLSALPDQVVALGELRVVLVAHVIERANVLRVVG